jgi:hypothetical protein
MKLKATYFGIASGVSVATRVAASDNRQALVTDHLHGIKQAENRRQKTEDRSNW